MTSTLESFLLFHFNNWFLYGSMILKICTMALYPVFVFALLFDQASSKSNPTAILKRLIIAQFVLLALPTYYKKTVDFGFKVGDSILKTQKKGLIGSWNKIQNKVKEKIKKEQRHKKNKNSIGLLSTVAALFVFDGMDLVEKAAAVLIFICILLIKIIYSIVYYATYCTSGIMAVLSVFPFFSNHLMGAVKSVLYLILTAIIIALVLTFMNSALQFNITGDGFLKGLFGISKFLVLCFVLLGSLKISQSLVNGVGAEGWAGNMGAMLGAGLAYKTMGTATQIAGGAGKGTGTILKNLAGPLGGAISGAGYMASRPLSTVGNSIKGALENTTNALSQEHLTKDYLGRPQTSNRGDYVANEPSHIDNFNQGRSLLKGRYENSFQKVTGNHGLKQSLNPINHIKSSLDSSKGLYKDISNISKDKIGLPKFSKKLTMSEKSAFIANKLIGGNSSPANASATYPGDFKNKAMINRINKIMRGKNV